MVASAGLPCRPPPARAPACPPPSQTLPPSRPVPCRAPRSWEALDSELQAIGVHPHCWPLPLSLMGVREAEKNPIPQPIPQLPTVKRGAEGEAVVSAGSSAVMAQHPCAACPAALQLHLHAAFCPCNHRPLSRPTHPPALPASSRFLRPAGAPRPQRRLRHLGPGPAVRV